MNTLTREEKAKYGLIAAGGAGMALTATQPVNAQATTPIQDMATEVALVTGIADAVIPLAIGTTVFAIGAVIVKRFAFS